MKIYYNIEISLLVILGLLSCACTCKEGKISFCEDDRDKIKAQIIQLVPIGSHVSLAKTVMEKEGFKCEFAQNEKFSEYGDDTKGYPINEKDNIDYL